MLGFESAAMGLDELLISTGVDSFIKLVHDKGKVELSAAAKSLNLPPQTVENWAHVLEEEGVIRIEYQFTKIYMIWIAPSAEALSQRVEKIEAKKTDVDARVNEMVKRLDEKGDELTSLQKEYSGVLESLDPKMARVSSRIAKLKELEKEKDEVYAQHLERMESLKSRMSDIWQKITEAEKSVSANKPAEPKVSKEDINYLKDYASELKGNMAHVEKSIAKIDSEITEHREALNRASEQFEKINGVKSEIADLKKLAEDAARGARESRQAAAEASASLKRLEKTVDDTESLKAVWARVEELNSKVGAAEKAAKDGLGRIAELEKIEKATKTTEVSGAEISAKLGELVRFSDELSKERARIHEDSESIVALIGEQVSAYEQMEALRDKSAKTGPASYVNMLQKLKSDYEKESAKIEKSNEELNTTIYSYKKDIESSMEEISSALEKAEAALSRKQEIEGILSMINQLRKEQEKLAGESKLLEKEIKVLDLQASSSGKPGSLDGIKQRIDLNEHEEAEFDKKREELRGLIKKMWEEGA